jgi:hypothetical protein
MGATDCAALSGARMGATEDQSRVMQYSKKARAVAFFCLPSFILWLLLDAAFLYFGPPKRPDAVSLVFMSSLFLGVPGGMAVLAALNLIYSPLKGLFVDPTKIEVRGLWHTKSVAMADIRFVRWRSLGRFGSVAIDTASQRVRIGFEHFSDDDRRWLIRFLHEQIGRDAQLRWDKFDWRIAQRLFAPEPVRGDPGTRVLKPIKWSWYCFAFFVVLVIGSVVNWSYQHRWELFLAPLVAPMICFALYCLSPREEVVIRRENPEKMKRKRWFVFVLLSVYVLDFLIAYAFFGLRWRQPMNDREVWTFLAVVIGSFLPVGLWEFFVERKRFNREFERTKQVWAGRPPWDPGRPMIPV